MRGGRTAMAGGVAAAVGAVADGGWAGRATGGVGATLAQALQAQAELMAEESAGLGHSQASQKTARSLARLSISRLGRHWLGANNAKQLISPLCKRALQ